MPVHDFLGTPPNSPPTTKNPHPMSSSIIVAGVDVGGSRKGFHCVALRDGAYLDQFASLHAAKIAAWCDRIGVRFIGVDAPCRWSATGRARPAERELMAEKIWCFSTPSRRTAETHPKDHFRWMLNGAELFEHLENTHALFAGNFGRLTCTICFETFPQAVACALAGTIVPAKQKRTVRRDLLNRAGVDISKLTNIDKVDAALCALAAHHFALGTFKTYGEAMTGLIVVPRSALAS
jgi:predicted nuclease with RNAse H fold